ncbi:DUF3139 domain-containing protein [Niallia sp. FSL R7-0648]|uniref:DUF3139 domain-containing protein n=1 Tax=Niallia sp. FSL R7-0648 TaxID=2954521 RepID=UPI0030F7DD90
MKKRIFLLLIFFVIFGGIGLYIYFSNNPSAKPSEERMEDICDKVEDYLINEKGYDKKEILSLEPQFDPRFAGSDAAYSVTVVFADEQDIEYQYGMNGNEVFQEGYSGSKDNPIHAEQ